MNLISPISFLISLVLNFSVTLFHFHNKCVIYLMNMNILSKVPFYLQSLEDSDLMIGLQDKKHAILTRNNSNAVPMFSDYSKGEMSLLMMENSFDKLGVANQSDELEFFSSKLHHNTSLKSIFFDKTSGILKMGRNDKCMTSKGEENRMKAEVCNQESSQKFKIVFSKEEPAYLVSKVNKNLAINLPETAGMNATMTEMAAATPLLINKDKDWDAPIVLAKNTAVGLASEHYRTVTSKLIDFKNYSQSVIFAVVSTDRGYKIKMKDSKNKVYCVTQSPKNLPIVMKACENNSYQLFDIVQQSKEKYTEKINVTQKVTLINQRYQVAVGSLKLHLTDIIAIEPEQATVFEFNPALKTLMISGTSLSLYNEKNRAFTYLYNGELKQQIEVNEVSGSESQIINKNVDMCLSLEDTSIKSRMIFVKCNKKDPKQLFNLKYTNQHKENRPHTLKKSFDKTSHIQIYNDKRNLTLLPGQHTNQPFYLGAITNAIIYEYNPDTGRLVVLKDPKHAMDVQRSTYEAIIRPTTENNDDSETDSQDINFEEKDDGTYRIMSNSKCLTENRNRVLFLDCSNNREQRFRITFINSGDLNPEDEESNEDHFVSGGYSMTRGRTTTTRTLTRRRRRTTTTTTTRRRRTTNRTTTNGTTTNGTRSFQNTQ
ncbi:hypothetical protein NUSPORA_00980 [Nucleospora cyclopteri]